MQEYAENVLIPCVESVVDEYPLNRKDQKALCFFDVFAAHRTDSFKERLDDNDIKIVFVPASCTGEMQPLDVAGNEHFLHILAWFVHYSNNFPSVLHSNLQEICISRGTSSFFPDKLFAEATMYH
jgi:hypothetical protein